LGGGNSWLGYGCPEIGSTRQLVRGRVYRFF
jgi:hypothetical protein